MRRCCWIWRPAAGTALRPGACPSGWAGLPLALHHAGSYLASPFAAEASFEEYEQALSVRFAELMGRGEMTGRG